MNREPVRAYVGMGGNVGDVVTTLMEAGWALDGLPQTSIRASSQMYRSPPWGQTEQAEFINSVVELQTRLAPRVLLDYLLEIEERFGRVRSEANRWGPRTLDLDLLTYGDETINEPGMHVPHPRLRERAFVLVPLAEIGAQQEIAGLGVVRDLLAAVDAGAIQVLED